MAPRPQELRALVLAPVGRDSETVRDLLSKAEIGAHSCADMTELVAEISNGVGMVLIAEEALQGPDLTVLLSLVAEQEPWSDLPFVVLSTNRGHAQVMSWRERMLQSLRNVSLLERPVQGITLVSTVRSALRARGRQYEMRAHLEERQRSASKLSVLVAERTKELETANEALRVQMKERAAIEERLRQAQKIEAIGQLTRGIAHDFNNLLMVITGGLTMLDKRPERRREIIEAMQKAAARGARLTHQLLAFSRRQSLNPQPIDLRRYLDEMSELLDRSLRGDVHVVTEFDENVWPVEADTSELQLVILNLAVNARDAMLQGGTIYIRVENAQREEATGNKDFVRISVVDTGTGIAPELIERIFDPFFTTKDVGKGSGLGLAQVHGFVTQSGGFVKVDSTVGKGTTISLLLPRSAREPDSQEPRRTDLMMGAQKKRGRVLIVEDEDEVAALVAQMFIELGFEVTRAVSATAALGALANGRIIDIVFSDVMMPGGMNGIELSREIRRRRPGMPVLLTSGYAEALKTDAQAEGVPLLPKPYQLEELAAAIEGLGRGTGPAHSLH